MTTIKKLTTKNVNPQCAKSPHIKLGACGEALVSKCYIERGWKILDRNWRCRQWGLVGELDIIAECKPDDFSNCLKSTQFENSHSKIDVNFEIGFENESLKNEPAKNVLAFCEVKTRSSYAFGTPAEAITVKKQRQIRQLAGVWLGQQDRHFSEIQFHVAEVINDEVNIFSY